MRSIRYISVLLIILSAACEGAEQSSGGAVSAEADVSGLVTSDPGSEPTFSGGPLERETGAPDAGPLGEGSCDGDRDPMGCPCDDDLSCESGACAATDGGRICVDPCVDSCPAGFECTRAGTGPDEVFLCLPRFAKLCQPCNDHNDCEVVEANRPARCITNGTQGSFCGAGCVADGDCPDGYLCEERNVGLRALESQCVPADGVCSCNAIGAAQGMGTRCERSNEIGTCSGMRKCTEEGLSECSAIFAEEERCDGMDNDCNGEIDDVGANRPCSVANEHGVCEGKATCYGGRELCDAPEPQAEVCDGVDSDCDGQTDEGTCDDGVSCTMDSCNA